MSAAVVLLNSKLPLALAEVENILLSPPHNKANSLPPVKPKGGEVYLFVGKEGKPRHPYKYAAVKYL